MMRPTAAIYYMPSFTPRATQPRTRRAGKYAEGGYFAFMIKMLIATLYSYAPHAAYNSA